MFLLLYSSALLRACRLLFFFSFSPFIFSFLALSWLNVSVDVEMRQPVAPDAANAKYFHENLAKMKMKIAM